MFFDTVVTYAYDDKYELAPTSQMTRDTDKIVKANWGQIKQMLTFLSHYKNTPVIEYGHIKQILLRLKEFVEQ